MSFSGRSAQKWRRPDSRDTFGEPPTPQTQGIWRNYGLSPFALLTTPSQQRTECQTGREGAESRRLAGCYCIGYRSMTRDVVPRNVLFSSLFIFWGTGGGGIVSLVTHSGFGTHRFKVLEYRFLSNRGVLSVEASQTQCSEKVACALASGTTTATPLLETHSHVCTVNTVKEMSFPVFGVRDSGAVSPTS